MLILDKAGTDKLLLQLENRKLLIPDISSVR